jgi:stage II sporulation protein D
VRRTAGALALALLAACAGGVPRPEAPPSAPPAAIPAAPEPLPRDSIGAIIEREAERSRGRDASIPFDEPPPGGAEEPGGRPIRVALGVAREETSLSSTGPWRLADQGGSTLVRVATDVTWRIEQRGDRVRALQGTLITPTRAGRLVATPDAGAVLRWGGRRYRGALAFIPTDTGLLVVNELPLEQYLRAVVAGEIGKRTEAEHAAAEAQAVAARSYAWVKLGSGRARPFDVVATVIDQVYGGVEAETPVADAAVVATRGLVLTYGGRVVNAPYHSSCGGTTAEPPDVWRSGTEPFLQRVSDRIPGTGRSWCDIAPRYRWTTTFSGDEVERLVARYLANGAAVRVRGAAVTGLTPGGRAAGIAFETSRGRLEARGNELRFVLRKGGELLASTWVELDPRPGPDGQLEALTVRGRGYGHGVGMCQWGAIGRARAGQDVRTILAAYYPGTQLRRVD